MSAEEPLLPHEPPRITSLPALGGALGPEPEHFVVEEVPLYEPSGAGDHWYAKLRKRGLTTNDLVNWVAREAQVRPRDIGYAGMKDKHAVTTQWLSLPAQAIAPERWQLPPNIELMEWSRHTNKLRTGHLEGNRFSITLVGVTEDDRRRAGALLESIGRTGLPNYFGEQRFGYGGQNLQRAIEWLSRPKGRDRRKARFYDKLYPSVLQSEVFNRYLSLRHQSGLERLLTGEVVRLSGSGSVFIVEDAAEEQHRLESGDVVLTGPMVGPRAVAARGTAEQLEAEARDALGLPAEAWETLGRAVRGTRRDLLVRLQGLEFESTRDDMLRIDFALPAGSYATQLLRELTVSPWLGARG